VLNGNQKSMNCKIFHADLWGDRLYKYQVLSESGFYDINWQEINPTSPFYLFIPQNTDLLAEYNQGEKITDIFPVNGVGMTTARDQIVIDFDQQPILERVTIFRDSEDKDEELCKKLNIPLKKGWNISNARKLIKQENDLKQHIIPVLYRPFDNRYIFYHDSLVWRTVKRIMKNIIDSNIVLLYTRPMSPSYEFSVSCTNFIFDQCAVGNKSAGAGISYGSPLYTYPNTENEQTNLFLEKTPNFSSDFLTKIQNKLGYLPDYESIFYYIYALFHSPTYRQRYAEFLKIDFPRLPLTSDDNLFKKLAIKGQELVELHLMKLPSPRGRGAGGEGFLITKYNQGENSQVTQVKYDSENQRIYINKHSYFEGINPEIWQFKIGGYQVLDKWLKDRKNAKRELTFDDILHYQKIVIVLAETINIMTEIDNIIPNFPLN
jgi:predicted helicase